MTVFETVAFGKFDLKIAQFRNDSPQLWAHSRRDIENARTH